MTRPWSKKSVHHQHLTPSSCHVDILPSYHRLRSSRVRPNGRHSIRRPPYRAIRTSPRPRRSRNPAQRLPSARLGLLRELHVTLEQSSRVYRMRAGWRKAPATSRLNKHPLLISYGLATLFAKSLLIDRINAGFNHVPVAR